MTKTQTQFDPRLVEFAEKLAALMAEYDASFEVTEETTNWETYASGVTIEVSHVGEYDGPKFFDIDSRYIHSSDVKRALRGK